MTVNLLKEVKARIDQEDIVELDLSQIKIGKITGDLKTRLDKLRKVQVLILSSCELQSLDGLPDWNLTILDISGNNLTDNALQKLTTYPELSQLLCAKNQIKNIKSFEILTPLKHLQEADFSENPVAKQTNYRSDVFALALQVLDGKDKDGNEVVASQEEFGEGSEEGDGEDGEDGEDQEQEEDYDDDEEQQSSEKPKKKKK